MSRAFDGIGGWIAAGLTALSSLTPNVAHASPLQPAAPVVAMHEATPAATASDLHTAGGARGPDGHGCRPASRSRCSPRARSATAPVGKRSGRSTVAARWTIAAPRGASRGACWADGTSSCHRSRHPRRPVASTWSPTRRSRLLRRTAVDEPDAASDPHVYVVEGWRLVLVDRRGHAAHRAGCRTHRSPSPRRDERA